MRQRPGAYHFLKRKNMLVAEVEKVDKVAAVLEGFLAPVTAAVTFGSPESQ